PALWIGLELIADVHRVLQASVPPLLICIPPEEEHVRTFTPGELGLKRLRPALRWTEIILDLDLWMLLVPDIVQKELPPLHIPLAHQAQRQGRRALGAGGRRGGGSRGWRRRG